MRALSLLLLLTSLGVVIITTTPTYAQTATTIHTFDSKLHGVRVHYSDGWSVYEHTYNSINSSGAVPRSVTQVHLAVAVCPTAQLESHWMLQIPSDITPEKLKPALCWVVPDGLSLVYQPNLNKSESPYLNGKQNITIDDYFAFDKQQYDANTARSDIKIINVTDTVIRVTNPTTNQTVRELPAKIIESVGRNLFTDEYETQTELITVNENTGYQFSDINIEDNEVLTNIPLIHLALRSFEILEG